MELQITGYFFSLLDMSFATNMKLYGAMQSRKGKEDREKVIMPTGSFSYNYTQPCFKHIRVPLQAIHSYHFMLYTVDVFPMLLLLPSFGIAFLFSLLRLHFKYQFMSKLLQVRICFSNRNFTNGIEKKSEKKRKRKRITSHHVY